MAHAPAAARRCRLRPPLARGPSCWRPATTLAAAQTAPRLGAARDDMVALAVTGTLQDGFSMRRNLDYTEPASGELVPAVFLGWALCRGLRAFLDVKEPGSREWDNPPVDGVPYINPACVVTGDPLHANVYAVFLVHRHAALHSLMNLPRYLAMSSDTVKVDLEAEETSPRVRELLTAHAARHGKANARAAAILAVVATFQAPTFVRSPVLYTKEDGTEVTNFHDSLAAWAGTTDAKRGEAEWREAVTHAIRREEKHFFSKFRSSEELSGQANGSVLGTDRSTARLGAVDGDLIARSSL